METLKALIFEGEHQQQDFKFRIDDQKKIARTLVAFANTDGGRLLIGVKDNGKIIGILPEEEFHMIEGAASIYCDPPVSFTHKIWQEDMKLVLEIDIPASPKRNHKAKDENGNWKIFIRRNDHTLLANKILLLVWKFEKDGINRPEKFTDEALSILKCIQQNPGMTLSQLYKHVHIPKKMIDHYLALFVYWGNVKMEISEDGVFYDV